MMSNKSSRDVIAAIFAAVESTATPKGDSKAASVRSFKEFGEKAFGKGDDPERMIAKESEGLGLKEDQGELDRILEGSRKKRRSGQAEKAKAKESGAIQAKQEELLKASKELSLLLKNPMEPGVVEVVLEAAGGKEVVPGKSDAVPFDIPHQPVDASEGEAADESNEPAQRDASAGDYSQEIEWLQRAIAILQQTHEARFFSHKTLDQWTGSEALFWSGVRYLAGRDLAGGDK